MSTCLDLDYLHFYSPLKILYLHHLLFMGIYLRAACPSWVLVLLLFLKSFTAFSNPSNTHSYPTPYNFLFPIRFYTGTYNNYWSCEQCRPREFLPLLAPLTNASPLFAIFTHPLVRDRLLEMLSKHDSDPLKNEASANFPFLLLFPPPLWKKFLTSCEFCGKDCVGHTVSPRSLENCDTKTETDRHPTKILTKRRPHAFRL